MTNILNGKDSSLHMRIWRGIHSVQGMGIWQDQAFVLHDTGICGVHDLREGKEEPLCVFKLGSWNEGVPHKDYKNHANSCMFSQTHYKGNPIPLLYVTIGTGTGYDEDGYFTGVPWRILGAQWMKREGSLTPPRQFRRLHTALRESRRQGLSSRAGDVPHF